MPETFVTKKEAEIWLSQVKKNLRHTGHTLSNRSGATLKDTTVRAGQSSEKAALVYQHSDVEQQREVASGLDDLVRAEREKRHKGASTHHTDKPTGI